MALIKHERHATPLAEVVTWPNERFDKAFRDMFRGYLPGWGIMDRFLEGAPSHLVHLEEYVEDGTCVIRAEMPGLDPDKDVEVSVSDGVLTLHAHREERKEDERPDSYSSEFHYGSFLRRIQLPEGATEADVKATYKDGILEIRVPMPAAATESKPTKIAVEHS